MLLLTKRPQRYGDPAPRQSSAMNPDALTTRPRRRRSALMIAANCAGCSNAGALPALGDSESLRGFGSFLEHDPFRKPAPPALRGRAHIFKIRSCCVVRDALPFAPSPRVPSGSLRPSTTGYGEGRHEGALPSVWKRPHRAEIGFSSLPRRPLPASGARNAVCAPPIAGPGRGPDSCCGPHTTP
jgi:hypothetical protein